MRYYRRLSLCTGRESSPQGQRKSRKRPLLRETQTIGQAENASKSKVHLLLLMMPDFPLLMSFLAAYFSPASRFSHKGLQRNIIA
jgi:hypothetical protein